MNPLGKKKIVFDLTDLEKVRKIHFKLYSSRLFY